MAMIRKFIKVHFLLTIRFRKLSHNNRLRTRRQLTSNTRTISRVKKIRHRNSILTIRISIRGLLHLYFINNTNQRHRLLTKRSRTSQNITFNSRQGTLSNISRNLLISSNVGQMFVNVRTIGNQRFTISRLKNKRTTNILRTRRKQIIHVRVSNSILVLIRQAHRITRRQTASRDNNTSNHVLQHPNRTKANRARAINKTRSSLITLRLSTSTNRRQAILLAKSHSKHLISNLDRNKKIRLTRFHQRRKRVQVFTFQRRLRNRNQLTQHSNRYKAVNKGVNFHDKRELNSINGRFTRRRGTANLIRTNFSIITYKGNMIRNKGLRYTIGNFRASTHRGQNYKAYISSAYNPYRNVNGDLKVSFSFRKMFLISFSPRTVLTVGTAAAGT